MILCTEFVTGFKHTPCVSALDVLDEDNILLRNRGSIPNLYTVKRPKNTIIIDDLSNH